MTTTETNTTTTNSFTQFALPAPLAAALARMNYTIPTPIQARAIPVALAGRDILGSARTGTGKTAAFALPMIARLMADPQAAALIISPTRELAAQILAVVDQLLGRNNPISSALLIGGASMNRQFDQLRMRPRIIIGTPGRINDHLERTPNMFRATTVLVLDEADRMLDMGFAPQIDRIVRTLPQKRQTLMFSATFPDAIVKLAQRYLIQPERISVDPVSVSAINITHETVNTQPDKKFGDLVAELQKREGSIIVFVRTKHGADRVAYKLERSGIEVSVIHGGMRQNQRERSINAFRASQTRIMIATDIAARGLDVPQIRHVINYDLPQCVEDYVHRVGRTARAGSSGSALALLLPDDHAKWSEIQRLVNRKTPGAIQTSQPRQAQPAQRQANGDGRSRNDNRRDDNRSGGQKRPFRYRGRGHGGHNHGNRQGGRAAA
ncbi:MAG TPA: DEAD/DEAH box helicase [Patescibacteria group bacterium]|nr:DEAD/DEAH box helicase [Patescibacteria group bacterium]